MKPFWRKRKHINLNVIEIQNVKVSNDKPPIWDDVCGAFKINPEAYFTYGDTIFNPSKLPLLPEIIEHEKIHMEQQKHNDIDAALWWGRYLREPEFRIDQEAKAYGRQHEFFCGLIKDRNSRYRHLVALGMSLSGPLYDHVIGTVDAMALIKKHSKIQ